MCGAEKRLINRICVCLCVDEKPVLVIFFRLHQTREPANLFLCWLLCAFWWIFYDCCCEKKHIKLFVVGRLIMRNTKLSLAYFLFVLSFSLTTIHGDMQCNFCLCFRLLMNDKSRLSCICEGVECRKCERRKTGDLKTLCTWNRRGQSKLCHGASKKLLSGESAVMIVRDCFVRSWNFDGNWNLIQFLRSDFIGCFVILLNFVGKLNWNLKMFRRKKSNVFKNKILLKF